MKIYLDVVINGELSEFKNKIKIDTKMFYQLKHVLIIHLIIGADTIQKKRHFYKTELNFPIPYIG